MKQDNKDCKSVREHELMKEFAAIYHDALEKASSEQKNSSVVNTFSISLGTENCSEHLPKRRNQTGWKVAIILFTIVILSSGLTIWVNSAPANAARFNVHRAFLNVKNLFTNNPQEVSVDDQPYISWETDSEEEMDAAKRFAPELAVPGYIPEGFKFENLKITKDLENLCTVEFHYKSNNGDQFWIAEFNQSKDEIVQVYGEGKEYEKDGKKYHVWMDEISENETIYALVNNIFVSIWGELSEEEMLKVVEMIN